MKSIHFGPHLIRGSEIFFRTKLSIAFVNLKPILPGHILVIPRRLVPRYIDLSMDEVTDLFHSVQVIGRALEKYYGCDSLTIAMQDGENAGQSVKHSHVHVIPRKGGDFKRNDDIYDHLNDWKLDSDRQERSLEMMKAEAQELMKLFPSFQEI